MCGGDMRGREAGGGLPGGGLEKKKGEDPPPPFLTAKVSARTTRTSGYPAVRSTLATAVDLPTPGAPVTSTAWVWHAAALCSELVAAATALSVATAEW